MFDQNLSPLVHDQHGLGSMVFEHCHLGQLIVIQDLVFLDKMSDGQGFDPLDQWIV